MTTFVYKGGRGGKKLQIYDYVVYEWPPTWSDMNESRGMIVVPVLGTLLKYKMSFSSGNKRIRCLFSVVVDSWTKQRISMSDRGLFRKLLLNY